MTYWELINVKLRDLDVETALVNQISGVRPRHAAHQGLTLIELMVVIVVLAVLLAIALPNFSALVKDNRLSAYSADIQSAMSLARSQAISRRRDITICPSSNSTSCNGTHWTEGLLVFVDGETIGAVDSGDDILKSVQFGEASASIDPLASDNFGEKSYLTYRPNGTVMNTGTLLICDNRAGNFGYQLRVWATGRVELTNRQSCT